MGNGRPVLGGAAVLVWSGTLALYAATGIGWWAAVPALAAAVLAALALPTPPRPGARADGPGRRVRSPLPTGPAPMGLGFPVPEGLPPGLSEGLSEAGPVGSGTVYRSGVSGSVLAWADGGAAVTGSGIGAGHRPLLEYTDDPLTPVAAETVTEGLERLFLRLGPPPGAARSPDRSAPTPRGDDR
ncbi:hypothetical protein ACFWJ4_37070 [Kitasatospora sp. NPDC127067]|uniref:hypothetical protein n=1 Tax=Kitasatospora sp. NPDC127067 TaxID=3347126 RepID=UPI0036521EEC